MQTDRPTDILFSLFSGPWRKFYINPFLPALNDGFEKLSATISVQRQANFFHSCALRVGKNLFRGNGQRVSGKEKFLLEKASFDLLLFSTIIRNLNIPGRSSIRRERVFPSSRRVGGITWRFEGIWNCAFFTYATFEPTFFFFFSFLYNRFVGLGLEA